LPKSAPARAVGGVDLKLVVLGTVNDVALFRIFSRRGASDYLVKPSTREALSAVLEKTSAAIRNDPRRVGRGDRLHRQAAAGVGATTSRPSPAPG